MDNKYDMCVDYNVLSSVEEKLKAIEKDLNKSIEMMIRAIMNAQDYLDGYQFEKARKTTNDCVKLAERTEKNIRNAEAYIEKLKVIIEKYDSYAYKGSRK